MLRMSQILWGLVLFASLLSSLMLSWSVHRVYDYGYAFWYDKLEIGQHIQTYGPKNRYIEGFETLSKEEHVEVFAEIVDSVHNHGIGLEAISFRDEYGLLQTMLRQPEVVHLKDVAHLIDLVMLIGWVCLGFALICLVFLVPAKVPINVPVQLSFIGMWVGLAVMALLISGPENVFYQFHVWVFPEGNQWFFYYQDSLMSTLMKAPDLFGGIAVSIAALGTFFYISFLLILSRL